MLLGIETSTRTGALALVRTDGELVGELRFHLTTPHSERLLNHLDFLLSGAGLDLDRLNAIAVSIGPGSFTGLRIGLSTAKGLAFRRHLPVIPVSSLKVLTRPLRYSALPVCAMVTSKRDEVYATLSRMENGVAVPTLDESPIHPEKLLAMIETPTLFTGDAAMARKEELRQRLGSLFRLAPAALSYPSAVSVAEEGAERLAAGDLPDPRTLSPRYLKSSEAERKWRPTPPS